jgi:succinate dehydrogenase/fumarate reductase iron-sulfur protein
MKATLLRYDPAIDPAPYYKDYEVPWRENITVLEVLMYIYENLDSIAFDFSCRGRVCGRCALMLDGEPIMACYEPVSSDRDITIEPLKGFPILRDFIVDKSKVYHRLSTMYNRIRHTPLTKSEIDETCDPELRTTLYSLEWCARCLCCMASCPVYNAAEGPGDFVGPSGQIALGMRFLDPYDEGDRVTEAVEKGLWSCIMCGKCDEVCPAGEIQHLTIYTLLRDAAKERGFEG